MNPSNEHSDYPESNSLLNTGLFRRIIDSLPESLQILTAIRDEKNNIHGFEILYSSRKAMEIFPAHAPGRQFLLGDLSAGDARFIDEVLQVVATGSENFSTYETGSGKLKSQFNQRIVKFEDGALVICQPVWENSKTQVIEEVASEDGFKKSLEMLQLAHDFPVFGVCVYNSVRDQSGKIIDFEFVLINIYSNNSEKYNDLIGKRLLERFPELRNAGLFEKFVAVVENNELLDIEDDNNMWLNEGRWTRRLGVKLGDGLVTSWMDITAQKVAETDLQKQTNLIRGISEASADLLYIMDIDTRHVFFTTRNIAKVLGYSEAVIGAMKEPLFEIMYEEDVPDMLAHIANMKSAVQGEVREIEYRMKHADGTLHFFRDRNTVFKRDEKGVPTEKLGISQDITPDHLNRIELAKQHSLLRQSEELAGSGSWEYDCDTKEFIWSDGMYWLFEMPKGTPVQPSVYLDYVIPEDRHIAEKLVAVIENNYEPTDFTVRIKPGDRVRTLQIKTTSLRDRKRKSQSILGVDMDITTVRAAEEKIQGLNKTLIAKNRELENVNSELKTFNNIAANDYKETLRSLYINLENVIQSDAGDMSDSGKGNIRKAQTAIQKMKLLTEDIVSFSRIPMLDNNISMVNLNDILQISRADLDQKIMESGAVVEGENLPTIPGMSVLLTLLFYHLLDNAIKFREKGKAPKIKIIGSEADSTAQHDAGMHYQVITITDDGIGFDGKDSEKLFSIFFRLHERSAYRGSGIGLAVCRKIMALHGGYITAEGIPGDGTVIKCYFPSETD